MQCIAGRELKETAYLLDRILGLPAHARMCDGVKAVQTRYEKAGISSQISAKIFFNAAIAGL